MSDEKTPNYYQGKDGTDVFDILKNHLTNEQYRGFLIGNGIKYLVRLGQKDSRVNDAAKAQHYAKELWRFESEIKENELYSAQDNTTPKHANHE